MLKKIYNNSNTNKKLKKIREGSMLASLLRDAEVNFLADWHQHLDLEVVQGKPI